MFKLCKKMLAAIGFVLCLFSSVFAYSGGNGDPNTPYQISTVSDWNDLKNTTANWNKCFILTADLDLQGVTLTPVGNSSIKFTGVFDGDDYVIRNVRINSPASNYIGLFGYVGSGGKIRNLSVEDVNITGVDYVGGLVGENYNGIISDCDVTGVVAGYRFVGGLAGQNGEAAHGTITGCYAACEVVGTGSSSSSSSSIGGLAGKNYVGSTITKSYAAGDVAGYCSARGGGFGGLVGLNAGDVNNCYASGAVFGSYRAGGLIGENSTITSGSHISACYSTGHVSADYYPGGLVGSNSGTISIFTSVWDVNTSGQPLSAGGPGVVGKTTTQMKTLTTFTSIGWDFATPVWKICDGKSYPRLAWQVSLAGDFVCPDGVGFEDLDYFVQRWLMTNCAANNDCDGADMKLDGTVNFLDFAVFAENWLEGI